MHFPSRLPYGLRRVRHLAFVASLATLATAQDRGPAADADAAQPPAPIEDNPQAALAAAVGETRVAPIDLRKSVVRVNSTKQSWNPAQPWEKLPPVRRRALGAIVSPTHILTTAEMVADATYVELESTDGTRSIRAKVMAVDYEANLALLTADSEDTTAQAFFSDQKPFELDQPLALGTPLEILQVEENGSPLLTSGQLQRVDVSSDFLPGQAFLTYIVKASMQSTASSNSLPVLHDGKLAGLLTSYNSKEQISMVAGVDLLRRFIEEADDGDYTGFPSLGVATARTEDPAFRDWLKLGADQGGIYINRVRAGGSADRAGIKEGDVVLAVDGFPLDRRGFYEHPIYGSLFWSHLVRGAKISGDVTQMKILREGEEMEIQVTLMREEPGSRIVPTYLFGEAPNFLLKGGMIFQELSLQLMQAYGEDWQQRVPLNLLDAYENPEKLESEVNRVIFLSAVIPTPATVGYESLRSLILDQVNNVTIVDMKSLIEAFNSPTEGVHQISFRDEDIVLYLDATLADAVDQQLLRNGVSQLSRSQ